MYTSQAKSDLSNFNTHKGQDQDLQTTEAGCQKPPLLPSVVPAAHAMALLPLLPGIEKGEAPYRRVVGLLSRKNKVGRWRWATP